MNRINKINNYFILLEIFNKNREKAIGFYFDLLNLCKKPKHKMYFDNEVNDEIPNIWELDFLEIMRILYDRSESEMINLVTNNLLKNKIFFDQEINFKNIFDICQRLINSIPFSKIFEEKIVHFDDEDYPIHLKTNVEYPPVCFFYRGNLEIIKNEKIVSIVGTRHPNISTINAIKKSVVSLAHNNFTIVSGLAKGVDAITHQNCLELNYNNIIAVIGTPLNKSYPIENTFLQQYIEKNGLLLSEYSNYENTLKFNFLRRNYFMSAVSKISIIMEASNTSGTVSQARSTLKNKRKIVVSEGILKDKNNSWPESLKNKFKVKIDSFNSVKELLNKVNEI